MSTNKTTILEHNERLSTLVEAVDNLPDAPRGELTITENGTYDVKVYESVAVNVAGSGGGGSGGSTEIDTCIVTVGRRTLAMLEACFTTYTPQAGITTTKTGAISQDTYITNVVCGSLVVLVTGIPVIPGYTVTGGAELIGNGHMNTTWIFKIPNNPTEAVSIIVRDDD